MFRNKKKSRIATELRNDEALVKAALKWHATKKKDDPTEFFEPAGMYGGLSMSFGADSQSFRKR